MENLKASKGLPVTFFVLDHILKIADDGTPNNVRYSEELLNPLDKSDFKD